MMVGSVVDYCMHHATCDVLVVKTPEDKKKKSKK